MTGWMKYAAIGLAVLALVAAIVLGVKGCKQGEYDATNQSINSGVAIERSAGQSEVINHVEAARNAVTNPTGNDLNVVCAKYDRNCKNGK